MQYVAFNVASTGDSAQPHFERTAVYTHDINTTHLHFRENVWLLVLVVRIPIPMRKERSRTQEFSQSVAVRMSTPIPSWLAVWDIICISEHQIIIVL